MISFVSGIIPLELRKSNNFSRCISFSKYYFLLVQYKAIQNLKQKV